MTEWQDMESHPRNGPVRLLLEDGSELTASWEPGFVDGDEKDCWGWVAAEDSDYPKNWSEGACWESNADEVQSTQPVAWKLPPPPKEG